MYIRSFLVGGLLSALVQIGIDKTSLTPGRILVFLSVLGCVLGMIGVYPKLVEFAGAGAFVPLPGFGSVMAEGVKKAVRERGFLGIFSGGLSAGAAGITMAMLCGFLVSLIFEPQEK